MTPAFAAQPCTFLVAVTKDTKGKISYTMHVVVGWMHVQGSMVFPLLAVNKDAIPGRKAVLHPGGEVSDNLSARTFRDMEDWLDHIGPDLSPGEDKPRPVAAEPEVAPSPDPVSEVEAEVQARETMTRLKGSGAIKTTDEPEEPAPAAAEKPKRKPRKRRKTAEDLI